MNLSAAWFIGQWARDPCEEIKRWKMAITRSKLSERERIRFDSFAWKIIRLYVRYFVEQKKKKNIRRFTIKFLDRNIPRNNEENISCPKSLRNWIWMNFFLSSRERMNPRGLRNNLPHGAIPVLAFLSLGRKWREGEREREKRRKNAETVEYNSCRHPSIM